MVGTNNNTAEQPTVVLGPRYAEAVAYASQLHAAQTRKTTTIPYISHLLGVSSLVLEAGGDEDMAIAALLHDGPEDQGGQATLDEIRTRFGDRVAHIVEGCTDSLAKDPEYKAPWKERKIAYLNHLKEADEDTLTVSLADKLHNARAIVTDLMIHGDITWDRFNGKKDGTLWYYQSILDIALESNAPEFLHVNLGPTVMDMSER
jgi:(p)ppGpp synthase/HD superfamily hydrolase